MSSNNFFFNQICHPANLMAAWQQVLENPGTDRGTVARYDHNLRDNLLSLAAQLGNGSYHAKKGYSPFQAVEDAIAQRAVFNAIEPVFEPSFLDCSFGFRRTRNLRMAAGRLLVYRERGDQCVVEAEVADCFGSLDHDLLMLLIGDRIEDERMLRLIWMWLGSGQMLSRAAPHTGPIQSGEPVGLWNGHADDPFRAAFAPAIFEAGERFAAFSREMSDDEDDEAYRRKFYSALKRFGRDAGLLALVSAIAWFVSKRLRRPISPKMIALGGASLFAALNYREAAQLLTERFSPDKAEGAAIQHSPLSQLLINIVLHEFDVAMTQAGAHLVRHGDRFVIAAPDEQTASAALARAEHELDGLKLRLNPRRTRIARFDQGVELFGYRFHESKLIATPAPQAEQWPGNPGGAVRKLAPTASRFGGKLKEFFQSGVGRIKSAFV
jgi:RNA-directed DNA polymerase